MIVDGDMNTAAHDIRYSELRFLQSFQAERRQVHLGSNEEAAIIGLSTALYTDLILVLLEELCVELTDIGKQLLVYRLRNETSPDLIQSGIEDYEWANPREALRRGLQTGQISNELRITYRGRRRIEELRDVLREGRILEKFGVLLDGRHFNGDLDDAVTRSSNTSLSVIRLDLDHFKRVNDTFGHHAGDVIMTHYFRNVREVIGSFGEAYCLGGDEVAVIVPGIGHERTTAIAQRMCAAVAAMRCEHQGATLPEVSVSVGVASAPPDERSRALDRLADERLYRAKDQGRNRVVS